MAAPTTTLRWAVADALEAALPTWQVTAHPRPVLGASTVVVAPGTPYVARDGFCQLRCQLEVGFYWSASSPDDDLDALDTFAVTVGWPALEAVPGVEGVEYDSARLVEVAPGKTLTLAVFTLTALVPDP